MIDVITILYGIAVGIIAIVGLYKAYKNDGKISREEFDSVVNTVDELMKQKKQ